MPHTPGHNGYGGMGGRSTRSGTTNRRRQRSASTSRPVRRNTASAAGRQRAAASNFRRTQRSTALQNRANQINQANTTSAVAGVPAGINIPADYVNKIVMDKTDGTGGHRVFMCKGNTITSQGCVEISNKRNVNSNFIATSGAPGSKLGHRNNRR
tara:strand:+ start:297 stop:761 length:465 start_codon:yes stop_codon:yes gene_type:complete